MLVRHTYYSICEILFLRVSTLHLANSVMRDVGIYNKAMQIVGRNTLIEFFHHPNPQERIHLLDKKLSGEDMRVDSKLARRPLNVTCGHC
jgi:hypothetical protein